ncbi:MAG: DNA alkylation repair protein [Limnochordia bacterium]|nr:DNA alkylation repair protein [Limnochordia bacterium]
MDWVIVVKADLAKFADEERAQHSARFFQTQPGGYGQGDRFLGIRVPDQRKIARKYYRDIPLEDVELLLQDAIHEHRLTALLILTYKFEKTSTIQRQAIVELYLRNIPYINNWDLVDTSAYKILGAYLFEVEDKSILYELAEAQNLWAQRIAMIATFYFIKHNEFDDALHIATLLLDHEHDLIHKAVGWMLREIGERDFQVEFAFLKAHYKDMPRVMLQYAIEKFEQELRQAFRQHSI